MNGSIISLSEFKAGASQLLSQLQDDAVPIVLTQNGRASAVVQSYASYQRMQSSLAMLKLLAQGEADVQAGRLVPQDQVFADARAKLAAGLKDHD